VVASVQLVDRSSMVSVDTAGRSAPQRRRPGPPTWGLHSRKLTTLLPRALTGFDWVTRRSPIGLVERRVVDWSAPVGGADGGRGAARSRRSQGRSVSGDNSCSLATLAEKERDRTRSRGRTARSGTRNVANRHKSSEHGLIVVDRGGGGLDTGARHGPRVAQGVEADREAIQEGQGPSRSVRRA
jgi:hypothetical protein